MCEHFFLNRAGDCCSAVQKLTRCELIHGDGEIFFPQILFHKAKPCSLADGWCFKTPCFILRVYRLKWYISHSAHCSNWEQWYSLSLSLFSPPPFNSFILCYIIVRGIVSNLASSAYLSESHIFLSGPSRRLINRIHVIPLLVRLWQELFAGLFNVSFVASFVNKCESCSALCLFPTVTQQFYKSCLFFHPSRYTHRIYMYAVFIARSSHSSNPCVT